MSFGMESSPDRTVAPVVVTAETLSKTASVKFSTVCERIKGSAPKAHTSAHEALVKKNMSRSRKCNILRRPVIMRSTAALAVAASLTRNALRSAEPEYKASTQGASIRKARPKRIEPSRNLMDENEINRVSIRSSAA
jgi:hypothetical protein